MKCDLKDIENLRETQNETCRYETLPLLLGPDLDPETSDSSATRLRKLRCHERYRLNPVCFIAARSSLLHLFQSSSSLGGDQSLMAWSESRSVSSSACSVSRWSTTVSRTLSSVRWNMF